MAPRRRWDTFVTSKPVLKPSARGGPDNYRSYVTISCPYCGWESNDLAEEAEDRHKGEFCRTHLAASPECAAQFGPFAPVQRKRRAVPASPEETPASPQTAAPAVAIGTPIDALPQTEGPTRDIELHAKVDKILGYVRAFERRGLKESSGSEDEAGKPARALDRYEETLRKDEQAETAKAMGLVPVLATESLETTRRRFKGTLDAEIDKRIEAEAGEAKTRAMAEQATTLADTFKRKYENARRDMEQGRRDMEQATAAAAEAKKRARLFKRQFEEANGAKEMLHDRINKLVEGSAGSASQASTLSNDKRKRRLQKAVHPDSIPPHLLTAEVQEYSTSIAQEVNAYFA